MLSILFPHLTEDVEFLLQAEDVPVPAGMRDSLVVPTGGASAPSSSPSRNGRRVHENAVAGPSRLG